MRFEEKLKKKSRSKIWAEYCGFLDMSMQDYMYIQNRLMQEQIKEWSRSGLGQKLLNGQKPESFEDLRRILPITTYDDYADVLLNRREDMLCDIPAVWIQTTWEGGLKPIKVAPYTTAMLDTYRHNLLSALIMATSTHEGDFDIEPYDRVLYGGAPLPYATGLMPSLFDQDIHLTWLPDSNTNSELSFNQRIKKGFSMALSGGLDYFFGIGSVANYITESFGKSGHSGGGANISIGNAFRYARAKYLSKRDGRAIVPGDIFHLKAFFYAGTDARFYRERLTRAWHIKPLELAAGTEQTCIGAEGNDDKGMIFFPDSCFYEFIPENEMRRSLRDPSYVPRTCLMNEVCAGENYAIVISVLHGGAFMRYRIGDVYHCMLAGNGTLPRFTFVDREPNVIDIAGFTRITKASMKEVIRLSHLKLGDWILKKEYDEKNNPFLHMYVEIPPETQEDEVTVTEVLTERLSVYFRYFDSDYGDLQKLLGIEPLSITVLKYGTIASYETSTGREIDRINPEMIDIIDLLKQQGSETERMTAI
ncbi:MAG: GH3 auxin-responsive promoter family protein [Solobacterium sp.]|jgi:hypothetical protein|nr:GH3 auxin-responsive promoter family protein [Solobacterium sp.]MCH4266731.1 GH3 auxin-responsive promoter family protein [Solobacterium sp.]